MRLTGTATAVWFAIFTGLVMASASSAQTPSATLRVGDRVRLTAPTLDSSPIVGRILRSDGTQLTVDIAKKSESPAERTIDWNSLSHIERSQGYKSRVGTGVLIGVAFGALVGLGGAMAGAQDAEALITAPLALAGVGMIAGAAVGAAASGERWSAIPLDARVGLRLGSASMPFAVGIRTTY
jgi:hypothetical protein